MNKYRERRVTNKTTYLGTTKACYILEKFWNRLRLWEGRVTDALQPGWWFGKCFNHIFNVTIRIIVLRQSCTLWSQNATCCFYYSENRREHMRTCVISNQGITPGRQSSNNLLFLLDCWEAFIVSLTLISGHAGEENKSLKNVTSINLNKRIIISPKCRLQWSKSSSPTEHVWLTCVIPQESWWWMISS